MSGAGDNICLPFKDISGNLFLNKMYTLRINNQYIFGFFWCLLFRKYFFMFITRCFYFTLFSCSFCDPMLNKLVS